MEKENSESLISSGHGKLAIRAWHGKAEPVKGLRLLISEIGKLAIRAWRLKIEPTNGLRRLVKEMGKFAIHSPLGHKLICTPRAIDEKWERPIRRAPISPYQRAGVRFAAADQNERAAPCRTLFISPGGFHLDGLRFQRVHKATDIFMKIQEPQRKPSMAHKFVFDPTGLLYAVEIPRDYRCQPKPKSVPVAKWAVNFVVSATENPSA